MVNNLIRSILLYFLKLDRSLFFILFSLSPYLYSRFGKKLLIRSRWMVVYLLRFTLLYLMFFLL